MKGCTCEQCEKKRAYSKAYNKAYYDMNRDAEIMRARSWQRANPDAARATARRYYANHRDDRLCYQADYREAHGDRLREYQRRYYEALVSDEIRYAKVCAYRRQWKRSRADARDADMLKELSGA